MSTRLLLVPAAALALLLVACAGAAAPTAAPAGQPIEEAAAPASTEAPPSPTPAPTSTPTAEPSPTAVPSPTATATPSIPRGTLLPRLDIGYGSGRVLGEFSQKHGLWVSPDDRRLIATTTAGIYTFSADDLSLLSFIRDPDSLGPMVPYARRVRISRDATLAATTGLIPGEEENTGGIRLWDLASGELINKFEVEAYDQYDQLEYLMSVDISPDNQRLAAVFEGGTIVLISIADGETVVIDRYVGITETPLFLEFDPTGEKLYYIFRDVSAVTLRSVALDSLTGEQVSSATAHTDFASWTLGAMSPVLNQAGRPFGYFTRRFPDVIDLWEFDPAIQRAFRIERQDRMSAISFSNNGEWIAVGGSSPVQLEVWALNETAGPRMTFPADSVLWAVAAASDGQRFYGISVDGTLSMWQTGQEAPAHTVQGFFPFAIGNPRPLGFLPLSFSPDGQSLQFSGVTSFTPPAANLYEVSIQDGTLQSVTSDPRILPTFAENVLVGLSVSPDGSRTAVIFFSLDYPTVSVFDTASGELVREIPFGYMLDDVLFMPDGRSLAVYGYQQPVVIVDSETGATLAEIPLDEELGGGLIEMDLSDDGSALALLGYSAAVVYDTATFDLIATFDDPAIIENTNTIAISGDGSVVAIQQYDGTLRLWDVASGSLLPPFQDVPNDFYRPVYLAFSPDSRMLAVARWDGTMRLFDIAP